jgi:hypothetical protein
VRNRSPLVPAVSPDPSPSLKSRVSRQVLRRRRNRHRRRGWRLCRSRSGSSGSCRRPSDPQPAPGRNRACVPGRFTYGGRIDPPVGKPHPACHARTKYLPSSRWPGPIHRMAFGRVDVGANKRPLPDRPGVDSGRASEPGAPGTQQSHRIVAAEQLAGEGTDGDPRSYAGSQMNPAGSTKT